MDYRPPVAKRKRGASSLSRKAVKRSWSECVELLRQANCTAALAGGGAVIVTGSDVLRENGCFGSQAGRRTQQQLQQQPEESEIGTVKKKLKLEEEEKEEELAVTPHPQQEEVDRPLQSADRRSSVATATGVSLAQEDRPFQLFPEETFYLCHNGWLTVQKEQDGYQQSLSLSHLWTHFLSQDSCFVEKYICYWHFRAQGWVPKCGLKFGTDFLLYKDGPDMHHSSYAVLVRGGYLGGGSRGSIDNLTWQDVAVSVRVNEAAKKEVLVCKVEPPANLMEDLSCVPPAVETMEHFSVQCIVVKRWVPEREREGQ